jgi:hypothetical protein
MTRMASGSWRFRTVISWRGNVEASMPARSATCSEINALDPVDRREGCDLVREKNGGQWVSEGIDEMIPSASHEEPVSGH